ncbi:MAG: altronate dehydratase family protein [Pirellulales bacterium]
MTLSNNSKSVIVIHPRDTVAVCLRRVEAGEQLQLDDHRLVRATQTVPPGHKVAISNHREGDSVLKFGWPIGEASSEITVGQHVHSHNLVCKHEIDYEAIATELPDPPMLDKRYTFDGFVRPNGRVGTRNYLAVISNVNCSASVARMIAKHFDTEEIRQQFPNVDGVISFRHEGGCAMAWEGSRHKMLSRVLGSMARHPNIGGFLLVGLGCEQGTLDHLVKSQNIHQINLPNRSSAGMMSTGISVQSNSAERPVPVLSIQDSGGTRKTALAGIEIVKQLLPEVNQATRTTVDAAHLILGTECGGSDGYSGITANPALGYAADMLVACGGTAVLSETSEIYGAEHLLTRRARSRAVGEKLLKRLDWWKQYCANYGEEFDNNPSVGNKAGGLTTITEKSLGAVSKGGSMIMEEVYEYAEQIDKRGFVFMDTPGYDPASVTGLAAGGANLIAFTTGRGSCFGFKPVPSFKIASNTLLFNRLSEDMDFNAGRIVDGQSLEQVGIELFLELLEVASGRRTCSEQLGIGDEEFVPWLVGPVL